jgi:hypothetical protein
MLLSVGRCRWPFVFEGVVLNQAKRFTAPSCCKYLPTLHRYYFSGRQESSTAGTYIHRRRDRRPPEVRLAAAILSCDAESLFQAERDTQVEQKLRQQIFDKLNLELPHKLKNSYSSGQERLRALQQLVVEEAFFSTVTALRSFQSRVQRKKKENWIQVQITGAPTQRTPWFEAHSDHPLSRWNQKHLRAGSVIVVIPSGKTFSDADVMFGVLLRRTSEKSQQCKLVGS